MNLGKVKRTIECPRPTPVVIPAPKPEEKPVQVPNWPVRQPQPAELPNK